MILWLGVLGCVLETFKAWGVPQNRGNILKVPRMRVVVFGGVLMALIFWRSYHEGCAHCGFLLGVNFPGKKSASASHSECNIGA